MAELVGTLFGAFVGLAIASLLYSLIGAIILRVAARWVAQVEQTYGEAYVTTLIAYLLTAGANLALGVIVGLAMPDSIDPETGEMSPMVGILSLIAGFLIQSGIYAKRMELTFPRAMLVSLMTMVIAVVIVLVVVLVLGGLIFATS